MKLLGLLALAIAVVAAYVPEYEQPQSQWIEDLVQQRTINEHEFLPNREYNFVYNGQLVTGVPGSSRHHAGQRFQAVVRLQINQNRQSILKIKDCRFGKLNERIPEPREIMPFEMFEQLEVQEELKNLLHKPVQFQYDNGMINEIQFDGSEKPWSANIKRSILNLLQVNMKKVREVFRVPPHLRTKVHTEGKPIFYTVMEPTLEGECECEYTVTPKPCQMPSSSPLDSPCNPESPMFQVIKTINFETCNKRPQIKYNERFQQLCPTCQSSFNNDEQTLVSSSVFKYDILCPENFENLETCLIKKSDVESQYNFVLFSDEANMISSYAKQEIKLVQTSPIENPISEPSSPISSDSQMIFTPDFEISEEKFMLEGQDDEFRENMFTTVPNKMNFIKDILTKLMRYTRGSVQEEAPRYLNRFVVALRMLNREELTECHQMFYENTPQGFTPEEHKKIKSILVDSLGLCGTKDCVYHLVQQIKENNIGTIKGAMAIKKLADVRVLSETMIRKVWSLCEDTDLCNECPVLQQSVFLTCGSMINALCRPSRDIWAVEFKKDNENKCPQSFKEFILKNSMKIFHSADSTYLKVLELKAISNAGLEIHLPELEKIIQDPEQKYSPFIRTEAILATKHMIDNVPSKVIKILMPIFMNRRELSTVRNTALYQLMQCLPSKPILDQITRQLAIERQPTVASFTYTLLQTMANSTNPCEKRVADDLKLSLRMARSLPVSQWMSNSRLLRSEWMSPKNKLGVQLEMASSYGPESAYMPSASAFNLNTVFAGMWTPRLLSVGYKQIGFEKTIRKIMREYGHHVQSPLAKLLSGKYDTPSPKFNYRSELNDIFNKLEITDRFNEDEQEAFGSLFLKLKNQEHWFLPISKEVMPSSIKNWFSSNNNLNKVIKEFTKILDDGSVTFNGLTATILHEQSRKIPTTFGVPLRVSIKVPTLVQATGNIKLNVDKKNPLRKFNIEFNDVKPSLVSSMITKVECWSPITVSGLKVITKAKLFVPVDGAINVDTTKSPTEIKVTWKPKVNREKELVRVETRPVAFVEVWPRVANKWVDVEERTIRGEEWTRVRKHYKEIGENAMGVKLISRAFWHHTPQKHVPSTPFCPLSGPNAYVLTMQPGYEMPEEITFSLTGTLFKTYNKKKVDVNFDKFYNLDTEDFLTESSSSSESDDIISSSDELSMEYQEKHTKYYKKYVGTKPVHNDLKLKISTRGTPVKRECEITTKCRCGDEMKACNCELNIKRTPVPNVETENWELNSVVELLYPETPLSMSDITPDKKFMCRINTKWGPKSNKQRKADIKIIAEQSPIMEEIKEKCLYKRLSLNPSHLESFKSLFSPVAQYKQTMKYSLLDQIKMDVDYKLSTDQMETINYWFRMLKNNYFSQSQVQQININNPENRLRVKLNIDPINRRYLNITVKSPNEETFLEDIPLVTEINSLNLRKMSKPSRSAYDFISQWVSPQKQMCEIRSDFVKTFDEVHYNVPVSTCFSVLAKDCHSSEESKFAVLIKKQSSSTEKKILKIVTPNTHLIIKATDTPNKPECQVNKNKKPCDQIGEIRAHGGHVLMSCDKYDDVVQCELPEAGIRVFFDGYSANVKVSPLYRNSVCGLCGHFDLNRDLEWINPEFERVSRREMFDSYLIQQGNCEHNFQEELWVPTWYENKFEHLPESFNNPMRLINAEIEPIKTTKMIELEDQICFSQRPVNKCPQHTYKIQQHPSVKVVYTCLPKYNPVERDDQPTYAERETEQLSVCVHLDEVDRNEYFRLTQNGLECQIPDYRSVLENKKGGFTETYSNVPKKCKIHHHNL